MSRAFAKEDDTGQPPIIPPRAALPHGTPNYVTPRGLALLRQELADLEAERTQVEANRDDEAERSRLLSIINGKLSALTERLASARLVDPGASPDNKVRFGATVKLRTRSGGKAGFERIFTIVGVDEASVAEGRVAFVAPIARAVQGARVGQVVKLQMGPAVEEVEVVAIEFDGK